MRPGHWDVFLEIGSSCDLLDVECEVTRYGRRMVFF